MRAGHRTSEMEKIEIAKNICELYAKDEHTIDDCCKSEGISYQTFNVWCEEVLEILELYKKAKAECNRTYNERIRLKTKRAIEKQIEGFDIEEITTEQTPLFDPAGNPIMYINEKGETVQKRLSKVRKTVKPFIPPPVLLIYNMNEKAKEEGVGNGEGAGNSKREDVLKEMIDRAKEEAAKRGK